jgi:hypothetical protein
MIKILARKIMVGYTILNANRLSENGVVFSFIKTSVKPGEQKIEKHRSCGLDFIDFAKILNFSSSILLIYGKCPTPKRYL